MSYDLLVAIKRFCQQSATTWSPSAGWQFSRAWNWSRMLIRHHRVADIASITTHSLTWLAEKKHRSVTFWHTSYVSVLKKKYFLFWERRVSLANGYVKIKQWKSQAWHRSWCGSPGQLVYHTMWKISIYLHQGWSPTRYILCALCNQRPLYKSAFELASEVLAMCWDLHANR